jgi:hypothetical protein
MKSRDQRPVDVASTRCASFRDSLACEANRPDPHPPVIDGTKRLGSLTLELRQIVFGNRENSSAGAVESAITGPADRAGSPLTARLFYDHASHKTKARR